MAKSNGAKARQTASAAATVDPDEDSTAEISPIHRIPLTAISEDRAHKLLKEHAGMVHKFAQRFMPRGSVVYHFDIEDLITCGQIAILEAAASYDPSRGAQLGTWIGHLIKRRMLEMVRRARGQTRAQQLTAVRLYSLEYRAGVRKRAARAGKEAKFHRPDPPTPKPREVSALQETLQWRSVSANAQISSEEDVTTTLLDVLQGDPDDCDPEVIAERHKRAQWLKQAMRRLLTPGQRQTLFAILQGNNTDIINELGVSRQRILQLKRSAIQKLRRAALEMGHGT